MVIFLPEFFILLFNHGVNLLCMINVTLWNVYTQPLKYFWKVLKQYTYLREDCCKREGLMHDKACLMCGNTDPVYLHSQQSLLMGNQPNLTTTQRSLMCAVTVPTIADRSNRRTLNRIRSCIYHIYSNILCKHFGWFWPSPGGAVKDQLEWMFSELAVRLDCS